MDPISVTIKTPKQSTTIEVGDDGAHKVSTGADVLTFSPDGHSRHSQNQEDADKAEVTRLAAILVADPANVEGITQEAWIAALVAEDKRARDAAAAAGTGDYAPNFPIGPFGVKFVDKAVEDNGPSIPFAGVTWPMEDPSANLLKWVGATPSLRFAIPDRAEAVLATAKFQTKPGWQLGWGPAA